MAKSKKLGFKILQILIGIIKIQLKEWLSKHIAGLKYGKVNRPGNSCVSSLVKKFYSKLRYLLLIED